MSKQNVVEEFFSTLGQNDLSGALEAVHEYAVFSVPGPDTVPIYGDFQGKQGVQVFSIGFLKHRVKKTGRIFECEWALVCRIKEGKIISYKMFEDTSALEKAYLNL